MLTKVDSVPGTRRNVGRYFFHLILHWECKINSKTYAELPKTCLIKKKKTSELGFSGDYGIFSIVIQREAHFRGLKA